MRSALSAGWRPKRPSSLCQPRGLRAGHRV